MARGIISSDYGAAEGSKLSRVSSLTHSPLIQVAGQQEGQFEGRQSSLWDKCYLSPR